MTQNDTIRVAALGDLHVHETPAGKYRELFRQISSQADLLLLCGDLTNLGSSAEAENLAADLQALTIPAAAVLGNHDFQTGNTVQVKKILRESKLVFVDDDPFEFEGIGIAGVKGFCGGFHNHMLSSFGEEAIKHFVSEAVKESLKLENVLRNFTSDRLLVVLHYSPIPDTVRGEPPEIFPFLGCSRLAEVIDRFNVTAVFHGHAHHGTHEGRTSRGVPVYNCSLDLLRRSHPDRPFTILELPRVHVPKEAAATTT